MAHLFRQPPRLPLIAPSILSADFARMEEDCRHVLSAGGDLLHLDVMDGHFVPNLTMGPDLCRALRRTLPGVFLDVHLMVTNPEKFVGPFGEAGANHLTFHMEAVHSPDAAAELAGQIREAGMSAGLAVNPPTPVDRFMAFVRTGDLLRGLDLILVMSVNPGFSGQAFMPEVLNKARAVKPEMLDGQRLEIDGGVDQNTAVSVRESGVDVLVAASAIFGRTRDERGAIIRELRGNP